jgi:hypothetical protein
MAGTAAACESVTIAGRPERVAVARAFVSAVLGRQHPEGETAVLLISELVTNSVRHSASCLPGQTITVTVRSDGEVIRVEVTDRSGTASSPGSPAHPTRRSGCAAPWSSSARRADVPATLTPCPNWKAPMKTAIAVHVPAEGSGRTRLLPPGLGRLSGEALRPLICRSALPDLVLGATSDSLRGLGPPGRLGSWSLTGHLEGDGVSFGTAAVPLAPDRPAGAVPRARLCQVSR